jgi:band 4.1-like protein 5
MNCLNNAPVSDVPCCVVLLDGREVPVQIKAEDKMLVLFRRICEMLALVDDSYFGLKYTTQEGSSYWMNLKKPVFAQLTNWTYPIRIYFGVKFYPGK